jgi:hypothetical protein
VARDSDDNDGFDPILLTADGIGPLAGQSVRVAGLFGGGLPRTTHDGWFLEAQARAWPTHSIYLRAPHTREPVCAGEDGACMLQAYGFSETGRSFVIATCCDVTTFTRDAPSDPAS